MAQIATTSAVRSLQLEMKRLNDQPVEGFRVRVLDDEDIFVWEVVIYGPPETLYAGGYFKVGSSGSKGNGTTIMVGNVKMVAFIVGECCLDTS